MFNVNCVAKLRISEQNTKRKTKYLPFAFSSERNFDEVKVTNKRAECKEKDEVFTLPPLDYGSLIAQRGAGRTLPAPRLYLILNFAC